MFYRKSVLALMLFMGLSSSSLAHADIAKPSNFREVIEVAPQNILVPTVLEVLVNIPRTERKDFLVLEEGTNKIIPSYLKEVSVVTPAIFAAEVQPGTGRAENLLDKNTATAVYFRLTNSGEQTAVINLSTTEPVTLSGFSLVLGENVAIPDTVKITALTGASSTVKEVILAKSRMSSRVVDFVPTLTKALSIELTYSQPLVISELSLFQTDVEQSLTQGLRFLSQPGMGYLIYQKPDNDFHFPTNTYTNLINDKDVLPVYASSVSTNPLYALSDTDSDGVPDVSDNCIAVANTNQLDVDGNGTGDVCDDWDRDGRFNNVDNCPNVPNVNQRDEDGDGIGDECDEEESRFTERNKWVPWAGMGIASLIIIGMFALVAKRTLPTPATKPEDEVGGSE